jgi:cellulose synthase/poly-beta-1,6-N-acetylglucosamine synthase-like glycosyltransferase
MRSLARRLSVRGWLLAPATVLVAIVVPATAYTLLGSELPQMLPGLQYLVASAYALTAMMTLLEARAALGSHDEPPTADIQDPLQLAELPTLTAIVSAYLPNEQELVAETIVHLATELRVAPGSLQIILAYNTPQDMPDVERVLASLAELNVAFVPLRVPASHSKSENVNAAMGYIRGEVTVLLDADHRPARDAAVRALRWFGSGYDIVQGRCVIRDHDANWLSRIVAVEFEQIYAVSHAGRSLAFDTAMFCGTNGWWRTSVLRQIGMDDQMLTEDIDSSVRALLAGHRTIHDRTIISTELAPPTPKAWWGQRMRWAQGWFQVTLKHQGAIVRSPRLNGELKLYWTYLLGWRELFPVLSLQIFALLLTNILLGRRFTWFDDPFLIVTTALTLVAGPLAAIMTYRVALESQRRELRHWFFIYAATSLVYTTAKNTVAMVATVRELLGERGWIVTTRAPASRRAAATAATTATTAALALLCAGALGVSAPSSAQARAPQTATVRLAPLASAMTLSGRAPVTTISVPVPGDWKSAGGTLHLRWQASPSVTPNSTLTVTVDGKLLGAQPLQGGLGRMDLRIAPHRVPGHALEIQIAGQLHTRIDTTCCIPDAATGAVVALTARTTRLSLIGRRASGNPLLADLPGSLADVVGSHATPLYVALPATPSEDDVRAAAVMAGAVARASGGASVPITVLRGATTARLLHVRGQVVRVLPQGTPRASVRRRPDGRLLVTVAGRGDGVVRAAWALARSRPRFYAGSHARVATGVDLPAPAPAAAVAKITPSGAEGTGPLLFSAGFRLPESRELTNRKAHLELNLGFSAPAGGRVDIALNGLPLMSRDLSTQGIGQERIAIDLVEDPVDAIDHRVALGNLNAGDNFLTIRTNLPAGQPVGGSGDAVVPELRVLPSSVVQYESRARAGGPQLDLWPWPYTSAPAMADTTLVLPADPAPGELASSIAVIAEAARWTSAPVAPKVAIAPSRLPGGDVIVLTRGLTAPVALPGGAPLAPREGLLQTYATGGRRLLVAYGTTALRPLTGGYHTGKVRGAAAVVGAHGRIETLANAPRPTSFEKRGLPWKFPAAIIVLGSLLLLVLRIRKVRGRLAELPPPAPAAPLDDAAVRAQLEEWERLVRQDSSATSAAGAATNGGKPRDDASLKP